MRGIRQTVSNSSLRKKIISMAFLTALLSLVICTILGAFIYNTAHRRTFIKQADENLSVITGQVGRVFSDTTLCSNYLTLSLNQIESAEDLKYYDKYNQITSLLNSSLLIFNGLDSIVYIDEAGDIFSTSYSLLKSSDTIKASPYYDTVSNSKNGKTYLFDLESICMYQAMDKPVITMGKKITNIKSGQTLGYLFLNINYSYISTISQVGQNHYFLYDANGTCFNPGNDELYLLVPQHSKRILRYNGMRYAIFSQTLSDYGWTVIYVVNLNDYFINVYQFVLLIAIASIIIFFVMFLLSIYITNRLTKPLGQLIDGAEEIAKGNLNVRFNFNSDDDIGRMGKAYNKMAEEISLLLARVDEEAARKRSYELALIQEQIKPHFLYNSLDIIIVLNEMNKTKEATRTTRKLADYYRNSLSSSAEFISLRTEFQILEDYLDLQSMRYPEKFTYLLNLPEEFEELMLPKLTLQPLVENALYHGIKEKVESGHISVIATDAGEQLQIIVEDDGLGMSKATVEKLQNDQEKLQNHFGVYSVRHRLQLYYHDNCQMHIQSTIGKGTTITILIPKDAAKEEGIHA